MAQKHRFKEGSVNSRSVLARRLKRGGRYPFFQFHTHRRKTSRRSVLSSIRAGRFTYRWRWADATMTTMTSVAAVASRATARVAVTSVASATGKRFEKATSVVASRATNVVAVISEASAEARRTSALTSTTRIKETDSPILG